MTPRLIWLAAAALCVSLALSAIIGIFVAGDAGFATCTVALEPDAALTCIGAVSVAISGAAVTTGVAGAVAVAICLLGAWRAGGASTQAGATSSDA